jgi:Domain of unknown function (DUF5916)/Carbohydrate family 9 binding domain-like
MKRILLQIFIFSSLIGFCQKKTLQTKFTSDKISIDGKLDEASWEKAEVAKDFIMFNPDNGKPIPENKRTEVKVIYDNDAIYVGAILHDDEPSKIMKEFSKRDETGTADFFGVFINGFNDGQQDFQFYVTAADNQADCQTTDTTGEDYSWDAVWESKVKITDIGWIVEMKIPYAALRFSAEKKQTWGLNFFREIRRDRQKYSWNFIDSKIGSFVQQIGILEGIENIKTPTRLFFLPYTSYYLNANAENKTKGTAKGGMDIKYGINDAFTLDAILIPDFGQTAVDQKILNLGPFEQQFQENRSFFTEGTDLFNKGNLLYSRRIGGRPFLNAKLSDNEETVESPANASLLNATKISGRTKDGLGIGFLNAVTENSYASIQDKITGITREELIDPLSNFNVLVFDQRFRKNSSVSFVNTNVIRDGEYRDANVSALVWDLKTKENTYGLQGNAKYSYINQENIKNGISSNLEFNKLSGKYRYGFGSELYTKDFDINDLGINNETDYYNFYGNASYRILNPTKLFNNFTLRTNLYTEFQKNTDKLKVNELNVNTNITTKKNHGVGMGINFNPFKVYDYYGPQTEGRFYIRPAEMSSWFYFSSNYNNTFALDINPFFGITTEKSRSYFGFNVSPRYRFSDRMSLIYDFNYDQQKNDKGYVTKIDTDKVDATPKDVIYAKRDVKTFTNKLTGKYSLTSRMSLNLLVRHYWSYSENKNFFLLNQNGTLSDYNLPVDNQDQDFSTWNFDLSYSWWFAPGSQISVLYRNNAANESDNINRNYTKNLNNLLNNQALSNTFSISLKYFIDYNQAKHWF